MTPNTLAMFAGESATVTISVSGQNTPNPTFTLVSQQNGITGETKTIALGTSDTFSISVATGVPAGGTYAATIRGTSASITKDNSVSLTTKVFLGNGTRRFTFDAAVPSSTQGYFARFAPEQDQACGAASDNSIAHVTIDSTQTNHFDPGPNPDISLHDTTNHLPMQHEAAHYAWNRLYQSPFVPLPQMGLNEGFAEACVDLAAARTNDSSAFNANLMLMDMLRGWSTSEMAAFDLSEMAAEESLMLYATAIAPTDTLAGNWNALSLARFNAAAMARLTEKQAGLTPAEWIAAGNDTALVPGETVPRTIDGQSLGTWLGATPFFADVDVQLKQGTYFRAWIGGDPLVNPYGFNAAVSRLTSNGSTAHTYLVVPVTLHITDTNGHDAITPINTDTGKRPFYIQNLQGTLAAGAYNFWADAVIDGATVRSKPVPIIIAPTMYQGTWNRQSSSYPGSYFITVDANGYAMAGNFSVTKGSIVWQGPGVAIVTPIPAGTLPAEVVVNGKPYTLFGNILARVITVSSSN